MVTKVAAALFSTRGIAVALNSNASTLSEEVVLPNYRKPNRSLKQNKNTKNKLHITDNMNCIGNECAITAVFFTKRGEISRSRCSICPHGHSHFQISHLCKSNKAGWPARKEATHLCCFHSHSGRFGHARRNHHMQTIETMCHFHPL